MPAAHVLQRGPSGQLPARRIYVDRILKAPSPLICGGAADKFELVINPRREADRSDVPQSMLTGRIKVIK